MKNIYILGSLNTDLVISSAIPAKGETIRGKDFFMNCGGKGANQAAAAAKLGGKVYMAGCVGKDAFGKNMKETLCGFGADVSFVREIDGVSSGIAMIILTDGDNRIILDGGANMRLEKSYVDALLAGAKDGDIFLTQLENNIEITGYALQAAKEKGLFTVLNPAPYSAEILPYLGYCDMITPNETELALMIGGQDSVDEMAKKIPVAEVLVTLGGKGFVSMVAEGERVKAGDVLARVDLGVLKAASLSPHVVVLLTSPESIAVFSMRTGKGLGGKSELAVYRTAEQKKE